MRRRDPDGEEAVFVRGVPAGRLDYADDQCLNGTTDENTRRVTRISQGAREDADMEVLVWVSDLTVRWLGQVLRLDNS